MRFQLLYPRLTEGVGKFGRMPADNQFAGNENGIVDLHELYRCSSGVGDRRLMEAERGNFHQHVQVYPNNTRCALFRQPPEQNMTKIIRAET